MRIIWWPPMLLLLATLLPSCSVYNDNPLSDPKEAKPDENLYGTWECPQCNSPATFAKAAGEDAPGMMKGSDSSGNSIQFFCTTLNGKTYMNIFHVKTKEENRTLPRYFFWRYAVTDDKLTIFGPNVHLIKNAIDNGQLQGKVTDANEYGIWRVDLKESTPNLRRFFESKTGQAVFANGNRFVYTRKKD